MAALERLRGRDLNPLRLAATGLCLHFPLRAALKRLPVTGSGIALGNGLLATEAPAFASGRLISPT